MENVIRRISKRNYGLPAALMALSSLLLLLAPLLERRAFVMRPGTDGALAMGIIGCLLASLEGLPFKRIMLLMTPVFVMQLVMCLRFSVSPLAFFGTQLMAFALFGAAAERLRPARVAEFGDAPPQSDAASRA